ncbi:thiol reductant ABC exporter subunit CydC [Actinoplanes sp. TBRC 11911]|uniref:thiol reductant ABC exporter subunit CydC n=1 Tax=Actinoplanes sp. TBRC 11911 TaxID=2729386 RepID=UPI00145EC6F2|nr:thiol reductant ABC exporter subunit CydC [Actinoplanes sp. TBRC 11911]NMO51585.1 thiol reductant ABC exporter subunit CydC [Actinoplanes sp. TBRC 11911]
MKGPLDPRLLRHARSSRPGIALLAVLGGGQALATLAVAVALTAIVVGRHGWAVALVGGAFVVRALLSWASEVVAQRTAAKVTGELRGKMLRAVLRRGPAWASAYGTGRLAATLTSGLDALRPWFGSFLPSLILGVALPPLVIVAIALVDPGSGLIALITLPLIPVMGALIGWATQARARQRWQADARLAGHFLDVVRGLPTLRVFGRASRQTEVIADLTDQHRSATLRVLRVAFLSSTALDLVGTLSVGLIAVEVGLRVAAGHLALAPALLVILLAPEAYRPLREMAARYHASANANAVIADVDEILTASVATLTAPSPQPPAPPAASPTWSQPPARPQPTSRPAQPPINPPDISEMSGGTPGQPARGERGDQATALQRGTLAGPAQPGIVASGIRVRYAGAGVDALRLSELVVRGGEIVALRGPSGAGKTTALRVLAGIQPADEGTFAVEAPLYLPQQPTLPHARKVADLFEPGTPDSEIDAALTAVGLSGAGTAASRARAETTADRAGADVTAGTALGEHGAGVSAGQRHRLALAALLHRAGHAPTTLLLDEPTAHLDAATEELVIERLRAAATAGSAILVVAHRPALLQAADRIVQVVPPGGGPEAGITMAPGPDETRPLNGGPELDKPAATSRLTEAPAATSRLTETPAATSRLTETPAATSRLTGHRPHPWAAVALGSSSSLAGLVLTGAAAWLLVRASAMPPVLTLSIAVVVVRGSAVARPLLRYVERLISHDVAFAKLGARRARIYSALVPRVPGPRLHRRGDLLTRVVDDVDAQVDGLLRGRLPRLATVVTVIVATAAALAISPTAAPALAVGLLLSAVVAPALAARQAARADEATGAARARLRDAVVETIDGLEDLAGRADGVPARRSQDLEAREAKAASAAGRAIALAHLGWGVAVAGTALALHGPAPEWAAVLLLAVVALGEPILALPDAAVARQRAAGADNRIDALTADPPSATFPVDSPTSTFPTYGLAPTNGVDLRIKDLDAGWARPVLTGFDLDLPKGSKVAVTGRSGSGKSTLAAVAARLLDPLKGTVEIDGADITLLPEATIRGRVVLVGDDTGHIFASTVRENLRLAHPTATDEELIKTLSRVRLGSWLTALPHGLDTWLGSGGTTMSGGQARRFAVARALLADPGLLILDEPTEGLDADVAEALMADLLDAADGRTVLMLTHRSEGLDRVDRILTLDAVGVS